MGKTNTMRLEHRTKLQPLFAALREHFGQMTLLQVAEAVGLPTWQVGRILAESTASPNYVDMTQLIIAAGMSPNEGAKHAGLWNGEEEMDETTERVVRMFKDPELTDESRGRLLYQMENFVLGEKLRLEAEHGQSRSVKVNNRPVKHVRSRAKAV